MNDISCVWAGFEDRGVMSVEFSLVYISECSGGSIVENKLLSLLACYSFLIVTAVSIRNVHPHLGHGVHTNSRQCYFHILYAFPFTRETKTCLPQSLIPCSEGRKSSLCFKKQTKPQLQNKPPSTYVKLPCLVSEWTAKWEGKGVKKKQMAVAICKPEKDSNNQLLSEVLAIKLGCRPGSLYLSLCLGYQHFGMFLHFQSVFSEIFHNVFIYFFARIFITRLFLSLINTTVSYFVFSVSLTVSYVDCCCKPHLRCSVSLKIIHRVAWLFTAICLT